MAAERATQPQDDVRSEQGGGQSMRSANTGMTGRSSRSGRSWRVTPATFADVEKARSKQQGNRPGNSSADGAEQPGGSVEAPTLMQQIQDNAQTLGVLGFLIFVSLIGTFPQVALWIAALQVSAIFCFAQSITYFMPCVCVCMYARTRAWSHVGVCSHVYACVHVFVPCVTLLALVLQLGAMFCFALKWEDDQWLAKGRGTGIGKYRGCRLFCQFVLCVIPGLLTGFMLWVAVVNATKQDMCDDVACSELDKS